MSARRALTCADTAAGTAAAGPRVTPGGGANVAGKRPQSGGSGARLVFSGNCPLCLISLLLRGWRSGKPALSEWKKLRASGGTADALASGASVRKGVGVQIPPRARNRKNPGLGPGFFCLTHAGEPASGFSGFPTFEGFLRRVAPTRRCGAAPVRQKWGNSAAADHPARPRGKTARLPAAPRARREVPQVPAGKRRRPVSHGLPRPGAGRRP